MNSKIFLLLFVVLVLFAGGFILFMQTNTAKNPADTKMQKDEPSMNIEKKEMKMDASMSSSMYDDQMRQMVAEGNTVMVMAGQISPSVVYATPNQEVMIANHESYNLSLIAQDGAFESETVVSGEDGSFQAPSKVGSYVYYVSGKLNLKGTLIVEE